MKLCTASSMRARWLLPFVALAAVQAERHSIRLTGSAQPSCWSVEEIVAGATRGAAGDRQKALALHRFGMAHLIHFNGPIEDPPVYVTDPMKLIGVYGYALCGNNSAAMAALYHAAGLQARVRSMKGHSVPEVWFEGKWNYIDTDMFGYVFLDDGRTIASVDELIQDAALFERQKNPPDPYYPFDEKSDMASVFRNAAAHKNYHPYSNAHLMNFSLRAGESASLYYRPRDRFYLRHMPEDLGTAYLDYWVVGPVRRGSLAWCDRPPAAYGNGLIEYAPDLRAEAFRLENPEQAGVAVTRERNRPALAGQTASLVIDVTTPWIVAGLQNDLTNWDDNSDGATASGWFWRASAKDENRIYVSADAGRTWHQVWENRYLGAVPFRVDFTPRVEGENSYRLKFEWTDRAGTGRVGLDRLKLATWVELSPMALPRLTAGHNSFELSTAPLKPFYSASQWRRGLPLPGERLENLALSDRVPYLRPTDPSRPAALVFRLGPSGPVEEARISILARRLSSQREFSMTLSLSSDGGETFQPLETFTRHPEHEMNHAWFNHAIRGRALEGERAWLKIAVTNGGLDKVIANSLVRAEPKAPGPIRITHQWREGEAPKTFTRAFEQGAGRYQVDAAPGLVNEMLRIEAPAR